MLRVCTPPRTLLTPQKISGPADKLDGRYLSRSFPQGLDGWLRGQGYIFDLQMGEGRSYHRENGRVETICRRFSVGFEVCSLTTRAGHS